MGSNQNRAVDHVGQAGADDAELIAVEEAVAADHLQGHVVAGEDLRHEPIGLVGDRGKVFVAQRHPPDVLVGVGVGLLHVLALGDLGPGAADQLGAFDDHAGTGGGGKGDRLARLAADRNVHGFPVQAAANQYGVAGAKRLGLTGAGDSLPGPRFRSLVAVASVRVFLINEVLFRRCRPRRQQQAEQACAAEIAIVGRRWVMARFSWDPAEK